MTRNKLWTRLLLYPGHTLPTAAAPVLVGVGLALRDGVFAPLPAVLFFVSSWLIHVAGVFTDNHELLRRHPGLPEHPELLEALADRTLALSTLRAAIGLCLLLALSSGAYLLFVGGLAAVLIGVVGVASSLGYHGGPLPYVKRGLADPIFLLMFGVVAPAALYYLQLVSLVPAGPWLTRWSPLPWTAYLVGLPVGALVTNVMIIDDIRDRDWDAQKGWRTGAVRWGLAWSRAEFAALMLLAYLAPPLMWLLGLGAWTLLPLLTLPLAAKALHTVLHVSQARALLPWTPRVARLSLIYAVLLALGLAVSNPALPPLQ
jgi:1,4-dihydroxy-2-naphthoate octaprenyltransferase